MDEGILINQKGIRAKTLSPKYKANYENTKVSEVTNISSQLETTAQDTTADLLERDTQIVLPIGYDVERWAMGASYAPVPTVATLTPLFFTSHTIQSNDAVIYRNGAKFYPSKKGVYHVSVSCLVMPNSAASLQWTSHEIHLYKNGAFYSILDANTVITTFGIVQNYHDVFDSLQGTDLISMQPNDYLDIRYIFSGLGGNMGLTDYFSGQINLQYLTNQSE